MTVFQANTKGSGPIPPIRGGGRAQALFFVPLREQNRAQMPYATLIFRACLKSFPCSQRFLRRTLFNRESTPAPRCYFQKKCQGMKIFFSTLEKLFSTLEKTFSRQEKKFSSVAVFLENNIGFPTPYVRPSPSGVWRRAAFIRDLRSREGRHCPSRSSTWWRQGRTSNRRLPSRCQAGWSDWQQRRCRSRPAWCSRRPRI